MLFPDRTKPFEGQSDAVLLRLLLKGEAAGEMDAFGDLDARGQLGVAWCALNRATVKKVALRIAILKPYAFSCFLDPPEGLGRKLLAAPMTDPIGWTRADAVADLFEAGLTTDPTHGATHYVVDRLWGKPHHRGAWYGAEEIAAGRTIEKVRISHHVFATCAF